MKNKLTFNSSLRYSSQDSYLYGIREHDVHDKANFFTNDWYIEMGGNGDTVSMNPSTSLNSLLKITYRVTPRLKFSGQYIGSNGESQSYVHFYKYNPDGRSQSLSNNYNGSLKVNHAIGKKTFYEAHIFSNQTNYKSFQFSPLDFGSAIPYQSGVDFGNEQDVLLFIEDAGQYEIGSNTITILNDRTDILPKSNYASSKNIQGAPSSPTFSFGGSNRGHTYRYSKSYGGKIDFTSQINNRHALKMGLQYRLDNLNERLFSVLYDDNTYRIPTIGPENASPSHSYYSENAIFFSGYIQDKLEYESFIMNWVLDMIYSILKVLILIVFLILKIL